MNMAKNLMGGFCLLILVMILFNPDQAIASSSAKSNTSSTTFQFCDGSIEDCLIADDQNVELLFESEQAMKPYNIGATFQGPPAVDCERGRSYASCLPLGQSARRGEPCGTVYFNRNRGCA